jgi:hemerythrin-like domain-containing protein
VSPDPRPPAGASTAALREEHRKLLEALQAVGERVETLHELPTMEQLALAREVLEFVRKQIAPHARAEEYTLYPAADWAAGENSRLTEAMRYEHGIVTARCDALEKMIQQGAAPGKLMHQSYAILGLIAAHFKVTEDVLLPYLDKAFDAARFEKEVLSPLRVERGAKR